ncbi:hypothetical protein [Sphingomonas trueperi]|uniref:hypothetical protein n=1 Tax=Sphingomonas trueperi TaxID=53317 RepID=UPI000EAF1333
MVLATGRNVPKDADDPQAAPDQHTPLGRSSMNVCYRRKLSLIDEQLVSLERMQLRSFDHGVGRIAATNRN